MRFVSQQFHIHLNPITAINLSHIFSIEIQLCFLKLKPIFLKCFSGFFHCIVFKRRFVLHGKITSVYWQKVKIQ